MSFVNRESLSSLRGPKITKLAALFLKKYDWWLVTAVALLAAFGLAALYSVGLVGSPQAGNFLYDFKKQLAATGLGLLAMLIMGGLNYTFYRATARLWYILSAALLLSVLIFGADIRGTRGWLVFNNLSFQPVELMKISLVLALAVVFSRFARSFKTLEFILASVMLLVVPVLLVLKQPDFGSAAVLILLWLSLVLIAGPRHSFLISLAVGGLLAFILGWFFFFLPYQRERLLTFINPARDPLGYGYNVTQSIIAAGSGRLWGRGLGFGSQSQLQFLPEAKSDFLFAVLAEELGLVGVILVLGCFALLFYRLINLARSARDDFALFVILGSLSLLFWQFFINVGMNLGLLPVAGLPLPFMSSGGTSLVINFLLMGLVQSVARSKIRPDERFNSLA